MSGAPPPVVIDRLDHLVLTVRDIAATCRFYERTLGLRTVAWDGRTALHLGRQKINLHQAGHEFEPKAAQATPGSGDFCLITETPLDAVLHHLAACGVAVELGPVPKQGALGAMRSVYFRDPDGNLVEVSNYL
jgi:catechol 2,3-dioxygenase-like lactoylglutathione lyase family enzyme